MTLLAVIAGVIAAAISLLTIAFLISIGINLFTRVPYAACPDSQITRIFDTLHLAPGTRVYDLGCGDGRMVFAAANRGLRATGFELQPLTYLRAKLAQLLWYPAADIRYGDFRHADLADADAVVCFLVGSVMPAVTAQLGRQLQTGTAVVSYGFPLPGWQPETILEPLLSQRSKIFIYQKP